MVSNSPEDSGKVRSVDDLASIFRIAEKRPAAFRLGAEAEKFGVHADSLTPLAYEGEQGVVRVLQALMEFGWLPEREVNGGPLIALRRGEASITLEPGAQLELSGAALLDVHAVRAEFESHLAELRAISETMRLVWLGVGFHPFAAQAELPWVPKQRYPIMREFLPRGGSGAHDMMRRTATVQINLDFESEEDAMRKLRVGLLLSPLLNAMTANSPFVERRPSGFKSARGNVWLHMDPARSGLVRRVATLPRPRYSDYVEWALDAGMFLFKREERVFANTGQTFRDFLQNGYQGERATLGDWKLHLNTLFPEVRLKNTIELRSCDALPLELTAAVPAIAAGMFYDDRALAEAEDLAESLGFEAVERARPDLVRGALAAEIAGIPARAHAERLLDIATGGLARRGRRDAEGRDESRHLELLKRFVERGHSPADRLLAGLDGAGPFDARAILERTRIDADIEAPA